MIHVAPLRAAVAATPGDFVGVSKAEYELMLDELEDGQRAKRELRILGAVAGTLGIDGVSATPKAPAGRR